MKKFGKILSSVLAASMLVSSFAMSVFAASTAHTVTLTPSKTEALTAGETITVTVALDGIQNLVSCGYELTYDTDAFEVDTTKGQTHNWVPYENCIDMEWLQNITNVSATPWPSFLGSPTYNVAEAGKINFQWAGSNGIPANFTDFAIGKFSIKVKESAANGEYTFALTGSTMDAGQNSEAAMVCAPVKVTVGAAAPTTKAVGLVATLKYDNTKTGVAFTVTDTVADLTSAPYQVSYAALAETTIENLAAITVGLNVTEVPKDSTLTATAELY